MNLIPTNVPTNLTNHNGLERTLTDKKKLHPIDFSWFAAFIES